MSEIQLIGSIALAILILIIIGFGIVFGKLNILRSEMKTMIRYKDEEKMKNDS